MEIDKHIAEFCRGRGIEIGGAGNYIEGLDSIKVDNKDEYVDRKYEIDVRLDATNLKSIKDDSVDYVVSVHVLEHISNPLKALVEWHRVVKPGGYIFTAVPQREYTFDRYRTTTTIRHLLEDYHRDVPPNDTAHLDEFGRYSAPLIYPKGKKMRVANRAVALGLIRYHRGKRLLPLTVKQRQLATRIDQDTQYQNQSAERGMELALTIERYLGNSILFVVKVGAGNADFQANLQVLMEGKFPVWIDRCSRTQETFRQPSPLDAYTYAPRLEKLKNILSKQGAMAALGVIGASIRRRV